MNNIPVLEEEPIKEPEEAALAKELRRRIEFEDELLNSRTTIFLGINSLWAAAVAVSSERDLQTGILFLGVVVTIMWLLCSWQSRMVIRALTIHLGNLPVTSAVSPPEKQVDALVRKVLHTSKIPYQLRPTNILAFSLPGFWLIAWGLFLLWLAG